MGAELAPNADSRDPGPVPDGTGPLADVGTISPIGEGGVLRHEIGAALDLLRFDANGIACSGP